jgi:hypothetical protein
VVGILRRAQRWRVVFVLLICQRWHFFLLLFSFGLGCAAAPAKLVVSCGCYINIAGRKPVSRERDEIIGKQATTAASSLSIYVGCVLLLRRWRICR